MAKKNTKKNENTVPATQAPLKISVSDMKNAAFALEILRIKGLDVVEILDGKVEAPETFTRDEMQQLALENGDPYFVNYWNKQKTDRGLLALAAATGQTIDYYKDLINNPPSFSRAGIKLTKMTHTTCSSKRTDPATGQTVIFEPKAFSAPDGTIHYKLTWLLDCVRECDRKMGRTAFLNRFERVSMDAPIENDDVVENDDEE